MYYYSAFNAWLPKQLHINIIYRGRLTSSWWYHFSRENLARSHSNDISSEIVLISHCLYRMNVRGAVLNEILHCVNIIYRGRLTSTWWYHFWRENLARSHSDDISSEIVLISHSLHSLNVRGAVLHEILHQVYVAERGKLRCTQWSHFWTSTVARGHSNDISSEIVLISHSLHSLNIRVAVLHEILHQVYVAERGKFSLSGGNP